MARTGPAVQCSLLVLCGLAAGCSGPDESRTPALNDSRPIVYTWFHTREDGFRTEMILTTGLDGGAPDTVFVGGGGWIDGLLDPPGLGPEFPAWSPNGEWIAFRGKFSLPGDSVWDTQRRRGTVRRSARGQIFIVRKDGSALRQLTDDAYHNTGPDWSPDGRWVVFQSEREEGSDLFVVDTSGSHTRRLTDRPGPDSSADWSPDGQQLVFFSERERGRGIYIMDADGSNVRWVTAGFQPTWSPDGRRIAFHARTCATLDPLALGDDERCRATGTFGVKGNLALWLIDPDGSNLKRVWPPHGEFASVRTADGRYSSNLGEYPLYPVWSPDGTHLAFHAPRPFYATDRRLQAQVDALVLKDSIWHESAEDLSPAEFEWLYANTFEREITIMVVDTSGVDAREVAFGLPDGGGHPEWY